MWNRFVRLAVRLLGDGEFTGLDEVLHPLLIDSQVPNRSHDHDRQYRPSGYELPFSGMRH
jgi:hypothetical protein